MRTKRLFDALIVLGIVGVLTIMYIFKTNEETITEIEEYEGDYQLLASSNFDLDAVLDLGYPVLIDIGDENCIPCMIMQPTLAELNEEWGEVAIIKFIDYVKYPHLGELFSFRVTPTQFFYKADGTLYRTHEGEMTRAEITAVFKEMGYNFD